MRAKKSENFTSYGFSFDLHHSLMESEVAPDCCYPHNTKGSALAKATGATGGQRKAAAKEAAAAQRAAASASAATKREAAAQRVQEGAGVGDAASAVAMADGPEQAPRKVALRGRVGWRELVEEVGSRRANVGDFGEAREARAVARGASTRARRWRLLLRGRQRPFDAFGARGRRGRGRRCKRCGDGGRP